MVWTFTPVPPRKTVAQLNEDFQNIADAVNAITSTGVGAGSYTYLVRKSGAVYEAYNSQASLVYGGSEDAGGADGDDAGAVWQAVLNALSDGDCVRFRRADYPTKIQLELAQNDITIIGEGVLSKLMPDPSFGGNHILNVTGQRVAFSDFTVWGKDSGGTKRATDGIHVEASGGGAHDQLLMKRVVSEYNTHYGVYVKAPGRSIIEKCVIDANDDDGLYLDSGGGSVTKITKNIIVNNDGSQIYANAVPVIELNQNEVGGTSGSPVVELYDCPVPLLINNNFETSSSIDRNVYVYTSIGAVSIIGNHIRGADEGLCVVGAEGGVISGNTFEEIGIRDMRFTATVNSVKVEGNYLDKGVVQVDSGAIIDWGNNYNYIVENDVYSDNFAIDSTGEKLVSCTHGLDFTPSYLDCTAVIGDVSALVNDWAIGYIRLHASDDTTATFAVKVTEATATGGTTAKLKVHFKKHR